MDIPKKASPLDSANEEAWQAWTKERGNISSPEPPGAGPNFDLDSVQTSQSLPNFQFSRGDRNPLATTCPCAADCNSQCCKSSRELLKARASPYNDGTPLLSPVKNTGSIQRAESPVGSYGSTDSSDQLITDQDHGGVCVFV